MTKEQAIQLFCDVAASGKAHRERTGIGMNRSSAHALYLQHNLVASLATNGNDWEPVSDKDMNELRCLNEVFHLTVEEAAALRSAWLRITGTIATEQEIRAML